MLFAQKLVRLDRCELNFKGAIAPQPVDAFQESAPSFEVFLDQRRVLQQGDQLEGRVRWEQHVEETINADDAHRLGLDGACTRSFGRTIMDLQELQEAVTEFACRAAEKLRRQECLAGQVLVFIDTSPFSLKDAQYSNSYTVPLRKPSADSASLIDAAARGLQRIYRPGFNFAKAGVMLLDIQDQGIEQHELQLDDAAPGRESLMRTIDTLNDRFGRGSIVFGSAGLAGDRRRWTMRQSMRTPAYTTNWAEIPVANAA